MHKKKMLFKTLFKDANASLVKCRNGCQLNLMKQDLILDFKKLTATLEFELKSTQYLGR